MARIQRHATLFAFAIGLIASAFAIAIVLNKTHIRIPQLPGQAFLAMLAVASSLPLVTVAISFAARPRLRAAWQRSEPASRQLFVVYLCVQSLVAVFLWGVFIVVALQR